MGQIEDDVFDVAKDISKFIKEYFDIHKDRKTGFKDERCYTGWNFRQDVVEYPLYYDDSVTPHIYESVFNKLDDETKDIPIYICFTDCHLSDDIYASMNIRAPFVKDCRYYVFHINDNVLSKTITINIDKKLYSELDKHGENQFEYFLYNVMSHELCHSVQQYARSSHNTVINPEKQLGMSVMYQKSNPFELDLTDSYDLDIYNHCNMMVQFIAEEEIEARLIQLESLLKNTNFRDYQIEELKKDYSNNLIKNKVNLDDIDNKRFKVITTILRNPAYKMIH